MDIPSATSPSTSSISSLEDEDRFQGLELVETGGAGVIPLKLEEELRLLPKQPTPAQRKRAQEELFHGKIGNIANPGIITPQKPDFPDPLHCWSKADEIHLFLWQLTLSYGKAEDDWFLHTNPIGFKDAEQKANWKEFGDSKQLHCFSQWIREPHYKATCIIGFFCTWIETWVDKPIEHWKKAPWHAWAAVLKWDKNAKKQGKSLIIWDSNAYLHPLPTKKEHLLGQQRNLIRYLKDSRYKIDDIWIGGSGNTNAGLCMKLTGEWVYELLKKGGLELNQLRDMGFRKLGEMRGLFDAPIRQPKDIEKASENSPTSSSLDVEGETEEE
jgi:hypothetical protein